MVLVNSSASEDKNQQGVEIYVHVSAAPYAAWPVNAEEISGEVVLSDLKDLSSSLCALSRTFHDKCTKIYSPMSQHNSLNQSFLYAAVKFYLVPQ